MIYFSKTSRIKLGYKATTKPIEEHSWEMYLKRHISKYFTTLKQVDTSNGYHTGLHWDELISRISGDEFGWRTATDVKTWPNFSKFNNFIQTQRKVVRDTECLAENKEFCAIRHVKFPTTMWNEVGSFNSPQWGIKLLVAINDINNIATWWGIGTGLRIYDNIWIAGWFRECSPFVWWAHEPQPVQGVVKKICQFVARHRWRSH